jgi:c-di-GMP-binding flagellar brake protein YcgR
LKKWKVAVEEGETVLLTEWSLHWFDDSGVRMGWLCLTDKRVLFLPVRAKGVAEKAVVYREVVRIGGQLNELGYLSFSAKGQAHRFSPCGGRDFVVRFWQDCKTEDKIVDQRETRGGQPVSRLLGDVRFIRLILEDDEIVYLKPAYLTAADKGIKVEIGRAGANAIPVGAPLVAEVGRTEGLYRFDCQVVELESDGPAAAGRTRLVLTQTGDICFYNRRASYRVDAAYEVEVRPLGKGRSKAGAGDEPAVGRLYDLSIGGCRVSLMSKLELTGRVSLTMPLGDGKVQVLARVIHCQPPTATRETRLYGMSFQRLSEVNRVRINQEVMRRDRALLRQRSQVKA